MKIEYYYQATCIKRDGRTKRKNFSIAILEFGDYFTSDMAHEAYEKADKWIESNSPYDKGTISLTHRTIKVEKLYIRKVVETCLN